MIYANVLDISMKSYTCFWFIKLKSWSNSLFTIFHFVKGIIQECHDLFLLFKKGLKVKHKIFMIYGQLLNVYRVTQENTYISPEKGGKWATHYDLLICKCFLRFLLFFPFKERIEGAVCLQTVKPLEANCDSWHWAMWIKLTWFDWKCGTCHGSPLCSCDPRAMVTETFIMQIIT